jgi:hypothetical protein
MQADKKSLRLAAAGMDAAYTLNRDSFYSPASKSFPLLLCSNEIDSYPGNKEKSTAGSTHLNLFMSSIDLLGFNNNHDGWQFKVER